MIIISVMIVSRHHKMRLGSIGDQYETKQTALKNWSYKWAGQREGRRRKEKWREDICSQRHSRSLAKRETILKSPDYYTDI